DTPVILLSLPPAPVSSTETVRLRKSFPAGATQQGLVLMGLDLLGSLTAGFSTNGLAAEAAATSNPSGAGASTAENSQPVSAEGRGASGSAGGTKYTRREAPPAMVHVKSPYESVTVIYDMYAQATDVQTTHKVFGTDV